jgi:zona occludens toxin (predicted ATPase)
MLVLIRNVMCAVHLLLASSFIVVGAQAKFPEITYADLYTYAGVVAVEESNGPKVPFRLGRADFTDGSTSPTDPRYVAVGCVAVNEAPNLDPATHPASSPPFVLTQPPGR